MKKITKEEYWFVIGIVMGVIMVVLYDLFQYIVGLYITDEAKLPLVKTLAGLLTIGFGIGLFFIARR